MTYYSTKTYGHNIGLACVFRQPNADHSHCHLLHGYSLAFRFTFGCNDLDDKNWAVDFGGLKPLKAWLEDKFDHKLALDKNDPQLERLLPVITRARSNFFSLFDGVIRKRSIYRTMGYRTQSPTHQYFTSPNRFSHAAKFGYQ